MTDLSDASNTSVPDLVEVKKDDRLLAIILRSSYRKPGIHFLTSGELSQQLAFMSRTAGTVIAPHIHSPVARQVTFTQEALFIRRGRLRVDFYDDQRRYHRSYELNPGDVILLIHGGHGFEVLEDSEFIEVKQGPYAGDQDKIRFSGISSRQAKLGG